MPRDDAELSESSIENHLRNGCTPYGAMVLKMNRVFTGFVDDLVLWGMIDKVPVVDFIECKRPKGGRDEKLQPRWHAKLRSMGYKVVKLRTKAQVDAYVAERTAGLPAGLRQPRGGIPLSLTPIVRHAASKPKADYRKPIPRR